ncbi:MAG: PEFG-CTERM sorting domain-containing protein [Thaumarchaeota archaeon]|nr:PEFG-CTERM sorting domain-containing protein [Nitrososphaerota archaeon]MDE1817165.1 PEFG-CTERM sorting domain-containing protein [Nitrososphaerota archaeon]
MTSRLVSTAILLSLFIITISSLTILASDNKNTNAMESFSFIKTAYAQNANTSDDYSGLGLSSDNPMSTVGLTNSTNSTTFGTNSTSGATIPEFGSIVPIVLAVSIVSIIMISARTKLRFN